jgi:hypothetical protein
MFALALVACGQPTVSASLTAVDTEPNDDRVITDENGDPVADLPVGAFEDALEGQWGSALSCKPIPAFAQLVAPRVILSIEGMTVHVVDEATGYDKVFPAGVGQIDTDESASTFGESLSYFPIVARKATKFQRASNVACKTWWTDPATGKKSPVFAGLPFMPFYGAYAIHGPIDNYTAPNGGSLTRGFVSHGCFRMRSEDILEVYARIGRLPNVPVVLQREPERLSSGARADTSRWVGSECETDSDCGFSGGFCHVNTIGGRGFCSARCDRTCADRAGSPSTFCVADPDAAGLGMCVVKVGPRNQSCRPYDHLQPKLLGRNGQPSVTATVCMPGTRGWIGDRCTASAQCQLGGTCRGDTGARVCTQACVRACPDIIGAPLTTCASDPALGGTACARVCTQSSNASECAEGSDCVERPRMAGGTRTVCSLP